MDSNATVVVDDAWLCRNVRMWTHDELRENPWQYGRGWSACGLWKATEAAAKKRGAALDALKLKLSSLVVENGVWPAVVTGMPEYSLIITECFRVDTAFLLAAVHGVDLSGVDTGTGGVKDVAKRCMDAGVPLSTPAYLLAFGKEAMRVANEETEGGEVLE